MALKVREILGFPELDGVRVLVAAGLDRPVRWVHTWPEVLPWLHGGELLLTTAYSWPQDPAEQRRIVSDLARTGVVAILFRAGGAFFPSTPTAVVEEARSLGLAVLEADHEVSFVDLTETINRAIIRSHFESLEQSERIHRELTEAALEAGAVADIASRLETLLGRPALVVDTRGQLLAGDAQLFAKLCEDPAFSPTAPQDGPVGEYALLARPVRTGVGVAAHLVLVSHATAPFRDVDVRAADHAALVIGLHLLRQQAVADAEARVRSTFVEAVLQGRLGEDPALRERAQLLGFDLHAPYVIALAVLLDPDGRASARPLVSTEEFRRRHRLAEAVDSALRGLRLSAFTALQLNQVVVLLPAEPPGRRLRDLVDALYALLRAQVPDLAVGLAVGRPRIQADQLPHSLHEAQAVLSVVRSPGVFWYEDALVLRILHSCHDRAALEALHQSTLGRLRAASKALEETARALVNHGFVQRAAARALGIHWNTLRYRVSQMEERLGDSLDNPDLRLRLHLAVLWETLDR
ncbi:MAG: PucR family transcriptional regulator ligand-binding domain-containing protein [Armatimonadota bacterium]|nr:PucR family transcriptional regulator ligand-binding domain-containing protein [Armatimonadota bacterium]MDW8156330.1 PucR family transcriptional regulator ligand-binding domain-containing protein [Armatimonadota bacterium]